MFDRTVFCFEKCNCCDSIAPNYAYPATGSSIPFRRLKRHRPLLPNSSCLPVVHSTQLTALHVPYLLTSRINPITIAVSQRSHNGITPATATYAMVLGMFPPAHTVNAAPSFELFGLVLCRSPSLPLWLFSEGKRQNLTAKIIVSHKNSPRTFQKYRDTLTRAAFLAASRPTARQWLPFAAPLPPRPPEDPCLVGQIQPVCLPIQWISYGDCNPNPSH